MMFIVPFQSSHYSSAYILVQDIFASSTIIKICQSALIQQLLQAFL
jgi:hypothetical protein